LGSKNKLKRFKENISFKNVIQPTREELIDNDFEYKGKWGELFFNNNNPIVIELGCGKGEYSVELAKLYPEINFIGIDIKGARFWRGAKIATDNEIANVAFVRSQIELVDKIFSKNEISEIWITFPDPQIKFKREKHRLINLNFIELYSKILVPNGIINLKTDSEFLHGYMLGLIKSTDFLELIYSNHNIYNNTGAPKNAVSIQTFYESKFLKQGKPITFVNFRVTK
jgi:tRNA (guanine-N7-)-methyltransferase